MLSVVSTEAPLDFARAPPFGPLRSRRRIGPKRGSANCANCANPQWRPPAGDQGFGRQGFASARGNLGNLPNPAGPTPEGVAG